MEDLYSTNIQWFPGHMTKTLRLIRKEIANVDAVVEILDARIPFSSQNPELRRACAGRRPRLFILNKSDLADPDATSRWLDYLRGRGFGAVSVDSKSAKEQARLRRDIDDWVDANVKSRNSLKPRLMFVGVPNAGKSTIINVIAREAVAEAANRPGVTRGKQWITTEHYELMDMPGVLWPKFSHVQSAYNLAYIGSIKDDVFDRETVASALLAQLAVTEPRTVREKIPEGAEMPEDGFGILELVGRKRGFLLKGGEVDTERAAAAVLQDMRSGKYGRITLEEPLVKE